MSNGDRVTLQEVMKKAWEDRRFLDDLTDNPAKALTDRGLELGSEDHTKLLATFTGPCPEKLKQAIRDWIDWLDDGKGGAPPWRPNPWDPNYPDLFDWGPTEGS